MEMEERDEIGVKGREREPWEEAKDQNRGRRQRRGQRNANGKETSGR